MNLKNSRLEMTVILMRYARRVHTSARIALGTISEGVEVKPSVEDAFRFGGTRSYQI